MQTINNWYELQKEADKKHHYRIREGSIIWYGKVIITVMTLLMGLVGWILLFY